MDEPEDRDKIIEKRVQYHVMVGSSVDKSTEAGRQLAHYLEGEERPTTGVYAGEASDRLYSAEAQIHIQAKEASARQENKIAVQNFMQAQAERHGREERVQLLKGFLPKEVKSNASFPVKVKEKTRVKRSKGECHVKVQSVSTVLTALGEYASSDDD